MFGIAFSGMHHENSNCEPENIISRIKQTSQSAKNSHQIYPKTLEIVNCVSVDTKLNSSYGKWSDVRDHDLCLSFTHVPSDQEFEHIQFIRN